MHWNEKIDIIKKKYSANEFSVPHVDRKEILRKIETKFIGRSAEYYDPNNLNERFSNWWVNIKSANEESIPFKNDLFNKLSLLIGLKEPFWIAGEFLDGVLIYKSSKDAALELISNGITWTNTFHLIDQKYESIISFRIQEELLKVKRVK